MRSISTRSSAVQSDFLRGNISGMRYNVRGIWSWRFFKITIVRTPNDNITPNSTFGQLKLQSCQ
jgi:hypothetical protein